jgi:uncharacterized membrane protein HdeD (DUF308 family)
MNSSFFNIIFNLFKPNWRSYLFQGIFFIFSGLIVIAFPEILIALVGTILVVVGLFIITIAYQLKKSETLNQEIKITNFE